MATSSDSRKHRITEDSDDDVIVVATRNVEQHRKPLKEILNHTSPTPKRSNKYRRVLDSVLLPRPIHTSATASNTVAEKPTQRSQHGSLPSDNLASQPSRTLGAAQATAKPELGTSRPRRSVARRSYVYTLPSNDKQNDLSAQSKNVRSHLRKGKAPQKTLSESSDFDVTNDSTSPSEDVHSDARSDGDASTEINEDSISENEALVPKARKKSAAGKAGSTTKPSKTGKTKPKATRMCKLTHRPKGLRGLDFSLPPLSASDEIFADSTRKAIDLGLEKVLDHLSGRPLRVATMCSGTESPLLALQMIRDSVKALLGRDLEIDHLFSAENVPFKQAYIDRNFAPLLIFGDVRELADAIRRQIPIATTAFGGKEIVPMVVDIVVAGTSCKDVSRLNNHQKTLADDGESGVTWRAVHAYCEKCRPAMVILENVLGAPWDEMLADYEAIGYEVGGVLLDSKDYYTPQTRQRGYMFCVDKRRPQYSQVKGAGRKWETLMGEFRRYTSSPVNSFLLPNEQISAQRQSHAEDTRRDINWERCKVTQAQYRLKKRLGEARSVTNWNEDGSRLPPDHSSRSWHEDQPERVEDTIDVAYRRKALPENGNYDAQYKTRVWNLSQNSYREEDGVPFGISPCITPSSLLYLSDAGRPIAPEELLRLQGLPQSKISFTSETPAEVQNLAGNAMSSPVVGCAQLAALIAAFQILDPGPGPQSQPRAVAQTYHSKLTMGPSVHTTVTSSSENVDIRPLLSKIRMAMRRCHCEGGHDLTTEPIQQCQDCGQSTCIACGGNPKHNYSQTSELDRARLPPSALEAELRSTLPLRIKLEPIDEDIFQTLRNEPKRSDDLISGYLGAVKQSAKEVFTMSSFRRTHCITMTYEAATARLELVMDDHVVEWRLFVLPSRELAQNDPLRRELEQPVAVSTPVTDVLFDNPWRWRAPPSRKLPIMIQAHGAKQPAWLPRIEMPDYPDQWQWEYLTFTLPDNENSALKQSIEGTFIFRPECGTAKSSLYVKTESNQDGTHMYCFLDPERLGHPEKDTFVFSTNISRQEPPYNEARLVVARIPSWQPWNQTQSQVKQVLEVPDVWTEIADAGKLQPCETQLGLQVPKSIGTLRDNLRCDQATALVSFDIPADYVSSSFDANGSSIPFDDHSFFSKYSWVFQELRRHSMFDQWQVFEHPKAAEKCNTCAPSLPRTKWKLNHDKEVVPYEDQRDATQYERASKQRSEPLLIEARAGKSETTCISLGINLLTLAHRASARLPHDTEDIRFEWKICASSSLSSQAASFTPFHLSNTEGYDPDSSDLECSIDLFPAQKTSLTWMRRQEAEHGQSCVMEESEEAHIPHLGLRVEMRASGYKYARGGICADHPGFGKTVTTLALVQSRFRDLEVPTILAELEAHQRMVSKRLLPSSATLIVPPKSLQKQWMGEINDKLGYDDGVYAISSVAALARLTIQDVQRAKIIVLDPSLLASEEYNARLAAFTGLPTLTATKGRAFSHWLAAANDIVPIHLKVWENSSLEDLRHTVTERYQQFVNDESLLASVPSQLLLAKKAVKDAELVHPHLESVGTPLFHMFYWDRMVVDEFHQFNPGHLHALRSLAVNKRWGLSGTPAMDDSYDIAQTASLLGITLRTGSDRRGVMKVKNIRTMRAEMTSAEQFNAMRQKLSGSVENRVRDVSQTFLDSFVRRNVENFDQIECQEYLVPVKLSLGTRAVYTELHQDGLSKAMRIQKTNSLRSTDRERGINKAVVGSATVEQAFSKLAALHELGQLQDGKGVSASIAADLKSLISTRERERDKYLQALLPAIVNAQANEPKVYADWKQSHLERNSIGDLDTVSAIKSLHTTANGLEEEQYVSANFETDSSTEEVEQSNSKKKRLREKTKIVGSLAGNLLVATRSLRFLKNVLALYQSDDKKSHLLCSSPTCAAHVNEVAVSANCGHLVCTKCHADMIGTTVCPADGCSATLRDYNLLWAKKLRESTQASSEPYGSKVAAIVDILQKIEQKDEQAILFVQYEDQLRLIKKALEHHDISATVVMDQKSAEKQIESFCKSAASSSNRKTTVLVLDQSGENAAGFNIQNANHVIFLSPLLRETLYDYSARMAQAVGRIRRHGQERKLYIWRIVALGTIDVDILEHREHRTTAIGEQGTLSIKPPEAAAILNMEASKPERTQLVCEDGKFSLRPKSWLVKCGIDVDAEAMARVRGKGKIAGWDDFSSGIKFSRTYTENDR